MKIIVIGAGGTLGRAVVAALSGAHEVLAASRRGPLRVDLEDPPSIDALFAAVPDVDAVVCCAAGGRLVDLATVTDAEFADGLHGKLLGQVAVARRAMHHLRDNGSIALTGGTFVSPLAGGSLGALVNSGLSGFVTNAASELTRGLRINLVSPGWIRETLVSLGMDPADGTPAAEVARHYRDCVEGSATGLTLS
jgi:NAD(P)-dependent dehydrogenase (short-subunit alcohol dehydrogenase family)